MINSQPEVVPHDLTSSISKGMGDQFSAGFAVGADHGQYIKGDG